MKIAFVTNLYTHYVAALFKLLSNRCDIDFYFTGGYETYWNKENKLQNPGEKGKQLDGFFLTPKFKISPGLFELLNKKYEVFIKTIDDRFALLFAFFVAKVLRKPLILWAGLWAHPTNMVHRFTRRPMEFIYKHSDAIVVYGEHVKRYLLSLGVSEERLFCAPHSVDNSVFNKFVDNKEKEDLKRRFGLSSGKVILFVGRLEICKGLDYLIDAIKAIKIPDLSVIFIGNGSEKERLQQKCQAILGKWLFLDHIPNEDLYRYYALADIFVLPSVTTREFKEPWGLVINEAMNQGCPIIATNAVGAAVGGLVENGKNGFVVQEKNAEELEMAITKLVSDEPLRLRMSMASRERIRHWTPENMVQGFIKAIEFVLSTRV